MLSLLRHRAPRYRGNDFVVEVTQNVEPTATINEDKEKISNTVVEVTQNVEPTATCQSRSDCGTYNVELTQNVEPTATKLKPYLVSVENLSKLLKMLSLLRLVNNTRHIGTNERRSYSKC